MKKVISVAAAIAAFVAPVAMASTPVMFSTVNGYNAPSDSDVKGVRLALIHGQVSEVKGVDFSVLGLSETDTTTGVNFGLFFGASKVNKQMTGASFGLLNWNEGLTTGANFGVVNYTNDVKGLNLSTVNYSEGNTMVDVGFASISEESMVQVGIFNMTNKIEGVQIGLLNCADNGFLKCFPFVNFAK